MNNLQTKLFETYRKSKQFCDPQRNMNPRRQQFIKNNIQMDFDTFNLFYEYVNTLPYYKEGSALIRIDKNKNFCKGNLKWEYKKPRLYIPAKVMNDTFKAINNRCTKPERRDFKNYGARGIQNKFASMEEFYDYLETLPNWKKGMQLDRIDTNGHYEKGNLRWVTQVENCYNKRTSKTYLDGVIKNSKNRFSSGIGYRKNDGKIGRRYLGCYKTEYEAHEAFVFAHIMLHGEAVFKLSDYIKD